ncbi:MAG TPA: GNAT family N-acetyltransferase [Planctomycetota bacterium]
MKIFGQQLGPRAVMRRCSAAELDEPGSAWNRAAARTVQADPFCCGTQWQLSFHEVFCPSRPLHLCEGAGSVIAFSEELDPRLGPVLEPVEAGWLFGCPLLGPNAVHLLDLFLRKELAAERKLPCVLVSGVLPGGQLARSLVQVCRTRFEVGVAEGARLCSASLEGGLDGFLSRRSGRLRRNLKSAARKASQSGVHYERCAPASAGEADAVYARMVAVEQKSWKGLGRCGMAEMPSKEFYARMLRRLAVSRDGRVMFARCGEQDVGFIFGGLAGGVYRGQQFSYAEDWSGLGIGNLLQVEKVRWLAEEGVVRYDMGPAMEYKRHWTEVETRIEAWLLRPVWGVG